VVGATIWVISRQGISLSDVKDAMARFSALSLLGALVCNMLQTLMMATRLGLVTRGAGYSDTIRRVLRAVGIGQMLNAVLPARAGDLGKIFFLSGEEGGDEGRVPVTAATAVVLADKLMDTLAFVLVLFGSGAFFLPEIREKVHGWMAVVLVAALGLIAWIVKKKVSSKKWIEFVAGFRGLTDKKYFSLSLLAACLVWVFEALTLRCLGQGLMIELSWDRAFFVLALLNLAIAVPVSVGNLGTFEASIVMALRAINVPLSEAVGMALAHHFFQIIGTLLWFLFALMIKKRSRPTLSPANIR
jgi:uncharacterized membrane protein YbhN (UPF0104 family)